jgi:hypothetical protein
LVLTQEFPIGVQGKNITSGMYTFYKPERSPEFNSRNPRVRLAMEKRAEKEKYILEERNNLCKAQTSKYLIYMKKIWTENEMEERETEMTDDEDLNMYGKENHAFDEIEEEERRENKKNRKKEKGKERDQRKQKERDGSLWEKGRRTRIINIYDQKIKNNPMA